MSKKTCGSTGQDGEEDQPTGKSCIYRLEMRKTNRKVRMEKEEEKIYFEFVTKSGRSDRHEHELIIVNLGKRP
jgi:hypothetical protein